MKIMFIIPNTTLRNKVNKRLAVPVGLYRLAADLRDIHIDLSQTGESNDWQTMPGCGAYHEVKILDTPAEGWENVREQKVDGFNFHVVGLSDKEILDRIIEFKPDIFGISAQYASQFNNALHLLNILKDPEYCLSLFRAEKLSAKDHAYLANIHAMPLVLGGVNASQSRHPANPDDDRACLEILPFANGADFLIEGPADLGMVRLVAAMEALADEDLENYLCKIPNLKILNKDLRTSKLCERKDITDKNISSGRSSAEPKIHDPNLLPIIDYASIPKENYQGARFHAGQALTPYFMDIFTSEGCNLNCRFCATKIFWGRYCELSDERVRAELNAIKRAGFTEICVHDDSLLTGPSRAIRIFKMIRETGFDKFTCIGGIEIKQLMCKLPTKDRPAALVSKYILDENGRKCLDKNDYERSEEMVILADPKKVEKFLKNARQNNGFEKISATETDCGIGESEIKKLIRFFPRTIELSHVRYVREIYDGKNIIKAMGENGCYRIYLAVESGNISTLNAVGKDRNLPEDFRYSEIEVGEMLDSAGIESHAGVMIGHPETESMSDIVNNLRFGKKLIAGGMARIQFWVYKVLPGTPLSYLMINKKFGRIRQDFGGCTSYDFGIGNVDSYRHGWTAEEITAIFTWVNKALSSGNWEKSKSQESDEEFENGIARFYADGRINSEGLYRLTLEYLYDRMREQMPFEKLIANYEKALRMVGRDIPANREEIIGRIVGIKKQKINIEIQVKVNGELKKLEFSL